MKAFPILRTIGTILHNEVILIKRLVEKSPNNDECFDVVGEPSWHEMEEHIILRDMENMDNGVVIKTDYSSDDEI